MTESKHRGRLSHHSLRRWTTLLGFILLAFLTGMFARFVQGEPPAGTTETAGTTIRTTRAQTTPRLTELGTIDYIPTIRTTKSTTAILLLPNPPGTLPITDKDVTLRVVVAQNPLVTSFKYGENAFTTWLEDRTGVSVEFILYPAEDSVAKFSTTWSADDPWDVVLGRMDRTMVDTYGLDGVFQPLNEPIRQSGYHIQSLLASQPDLRVGITAYNGSIYGLPMPSSDETLDPDDYGMRMWIHRGFLEACGQGMPATTEEFRQFLTWVRDADANGNGDSGDEVGWAGAEKASVPYARPTDFLMNAFTMQDGFGYYVKNDTIHCAMVEEGYRNGLRYLNSLMTSGLMDPNYPSNDERAIRALVGQNGGDTVAAVSARHLSTLSTDPAIQAKYMVVPPLVGPDGFVNAYYEYFAAVGAPRRNAAAFSGSFSSSNWSSTCAAMITAGCTQPAIAMAWLDALYDPAVLERALYGVPEVDWAVPAAGTVAVDGGPASVNLLRDVWNADTSSTWGTSFPLVARIRSASLLLLPAESHSAAATEYQAARAYEPYVIPCSLPPFSYDQATATNANEWRTNVNDFTRSAITDFIFSNLNVNADSVWADYVAQVHALGLTEYLAMMQSSYDKNWSGSLPALYTVKPQRVR